MTCNTIGLKYRKIKGLKCMTECMNPILQCITIVLKHRKIKDLICMIYRKYLKKLLYFNIILISYVFCYNKIC